MQTFKFLLPIGLPVLGIVLLSSCSEEKPHQVVKPTTPIAVRLYQNGASLGQGSGQSIPATLVSKERVDISTRVMGTLTQLSVEEGDYVQAGQVLGHVASGDLQASRARVEAGIAEGQAMLDNYTKDFERIQKLYNQGSATAKELDDIRMAQKSAKARIEAARQAQKEVETQLGYATLTAPISGWVAQRYQQAGSMVSPGMPILAIEGNSGFKVVAQVSENELSTLKVGQQTWVQIPSLQTRLQATVTALSPNRAMTTGAYEATLSLATTPKGLRAGQFARVETGQANTKAEIWLPDSLLHNRGGVQAVFVASASKEALLRWVRIGRREGNQVQILAGIDGQDALIATAQGPLQDGSPISVVQ